MFMPDSSCIAEYDEEGGEGGIRIITQLHSLIHEKNKK